MFRITAVRGDECGFRLGVGAPIDYDSVERRNWNDPLPIGAGIYARVSTEDHVQEPAGLRIPVRGVAC